MNHDEYLEKLSAVADWKKGDLARASRGPKKPVKNNTYPIELVEIHNKSTACKHCGKMCDQTPQIDLRREKSVWVRKCLECKLYQNPETGEFDMKPISIAAWLRKKS